MFCWHQPEYIMPSISDMIPITAELLEADNLDAANFLIFFATRYIERCVFSQLQKLADRLKDAKAQGLREFLRCVLFILSGSIKMISIGDLLQHLEEVGNFPYSKHEH
jgi:hypothetical protein